MNSLYHPFRNVTLKTMKLSQNGNGFWFRLASDNPQQFEYAKRFLRAMGRDRVFYSNQNYMWYIKKYCLPQLAEHIPGMSERAAELVAQDDAARRAVA